MAIPEDRLKEYRKFNTKLSPERVQELAEWCYLAWVSYWSDYAPSSSNRVDLIKYVLRDNYDNKKLAEILVAIKMQKKLYIAQDRAGKKPFGVRGLQVWYNKRIFDEMNAKESFVDLKSQENGQLCGKEGCNLELHGDNYKYCTTHLYEYIEKEKDKFVHVRNLEELGLWDKSQTPKERAEACRALISGKLNSLIG